jgi:hypothetical protein
MQRGDIKGMTALGADAMVAQPAQIMHTVSARASTAGTNGLFDSPQPSCHNENGNPLWSEDDEWDAHTPPEVWCWHRRSDWRHPEQHCSTEPDDRTQKKPPLQPTQGGRNGRT